MGTKHPEKIGPFEVASIIGEGAMGSVYKASKPDSGDVVAIKVLRPQFVEDEEAVERFHREAEAVSRLRHPNLVRIIEKEQLDEVLYFVMEYVPGSSLEAVLRRRRLSLPEAFTVFKKVCAGLRAAHDEKIVHRDLSPRNILVSEDLGTVKIVDFGISRVESISREQGTLSTSQVSLGSLHYMAPEQAVDMRETDHRADIYSLGVLLYEMLTGRVPVGRFNLPSALNSEVPSETDRIVLRCLETNPAKRYDSVARLLRDLERLEDQLRLGLVSELKGLSRSTSKIFRKPERRWTKWGLTAAALLVAAVASLYLVLQRQAVGTPAVGDVETVTADLRTIQVTPAGATETPEEAPVLDIGEVEPPEEADGESADENDAEPTETTSAAPAAEPAPQPAAPQATPATQAGEDLEVARAKVEAGLYEPALRDLEDLMGSGASDRVVAAALLLKGEAHRKQGAIAEAKAAWIELDSRFRGSGAAGDGSYRLAQLEMAENGKSDPRGVWKAYNNTIAAYPSSQWAARALMDRADLEEAEKWKIDDSELGVKVPMALISYRQMAQAFPRDPAAQKALLGLGEMYSDLRRHELAAAAYRQLATSFPDNRHDAWWKLGQVYDRRLDDTEKAVAAYEKVPQGSRYYDDAQKRLSRLKR